MAGLPLSSIVPQWIGVVNTSDGLATAQEETASSG